jgi:large subunit ribosomal protein LP1
MPFKVPSDEKPELLVTFAALILNDDKVPITAENLTKLIEAAGADIESYWPKLFAQLLEGRDVNELLLNAGGTPGAAPAGGAAAGGAAPAAAEAPKGKEKEKEKEKEEEEEVDLGFSLFD